MARFQPRIFLNNPEKDVPENVSEQFFLAIKSGDIDRIRDFALQYKNKYNIIQQKSGKAVSPDKTPIHVVLELDDKIANNTNKLIIIKFLEEMGAPMDLPDADDVWPIHLAAALQDPDILNFLKSRGVKLNRLDSSNNTPLHYAINGREIECPIPPSVKALTPPRNLDTIIYNDVLTDANKTLEKYIGQIPEVHEDLIDLIDTVTKIPETYRDDKLTTEIETEIVKIFADTSTDPSYQPDNPFFLEQQSKLEQLIEKVRSKIIDGPLKGVTDKLPIGPNNKGWGPQIPTDHGFRDPTNLEKILDDDQGSYQREINTIYETKLQDINTLGTKNIDMAISKNFLSTQKTIGDSFVKLYDLGFDTVLTKMLFLLIWNNYVHDYPRIFAEKITQFKLLDQALFTQIKDLKNFVNPAFGTSDDVLFNRDLDDVIADLDNAKDAEKFDEYISKNINNRNGKCVLGKLRELFGNSDDVGSTRINLYTSPLYQAPLSTLMKNPLFTSLQPFLNNHNVQNLSWFNVLYNFIINIRPQSDPINADDFVFIDKISNNLQVPKTPLPSALEHNPTIPPNNNNYAYTFFELFRIFGYLEGFLIRADIDAEGYPAIFDENIDAWEKYIDDIGQTPIDVFVNGRVGSIEDEYPEFIFLYKILVSYAQDEIKRCFVECITSIINDAIDMGPDEDDSVELYRYYNVGNNFTLFNILLPSLPDVLELADVGRVFIPTHEPYITLEGQTWSTDSNIFKNYSKISDIVSVDLQSKVINMLSDIVDSQDPKTISLDFYDEIRKNIELFAADENNNADDIKNVISNNAFRTLITEHLRKYNIFPTLVQVLPDLKIRDYFEENLSNLQEKEMTPLFFSIETYGYEVYRFFKILGRYKSYISNIGDITSDIISFINKQTYYYIPQIFLPALIGRTLIAIQRLVQIQDSFQQTKIRNNDFYSQINTSDTTIRAIIDLYDQVSVLVRRELTDLYQKGIVAVVKFHDSVINFINIHSARQIINSQRRFFSTNLPQFGDLPDLLKIGADLNLIARNLNAYRIPEITYYSDAAEINDVNFDVFGEMDRRIAPDVYVSTTYRGFYYQRRGIISNSPIANFNNQLDVYTDGTDYLFSIVDPIPGKWLYIDPRNHWVIRYADAFIAHSEEDVDYPENRLTLSVRELSGIYLKNLKQQIVQNVVQYVVNQHANGAPAEIVKMYNDLAASGNNSVGSDTSVYIVVARLTDAILNKLINYSLNQSISDWIYSISSKNPVTFRNANHSIEIINQKNYQRLTLNHIDKNQIIDHVNNKYLDFELIQVEPNPNVLDYTTKPVANELVHYLYNINYFSEANVNTNHKCRQINPEIALSLMNSSTINAKNSDGNTPLHYAVIMNDAELVELLIEHGAKPRGFVNLKGQTPYDMSLEILHQHLKYTIDLKHPKISDTIQNFVKPFNDLLVARLRDEKFGNNIIKNITLAIPIQIIMYNHTFRLYMENYRFGFTSQLKNSIKTIIGGKYHFGSSIYPIDLFQIENKQELINIIEANPLQHIQNNINSVNSKKINITQRQIDEIKNQLDGLSKEKSITKDSQQISFIDQLDSELKDQLAKLEKKMKKIQMTTVSTIDDDDMKFYLEAIQSIDNIVIDRSFDIVQFYDLGFNRISRNKNFYASVWKNYINKSLTSAPSMIFSVLNDTINNLLNDNGKIPIDNPLLKDLTTLVPTNFQDKIEKIVDFFVIVKKYIESRDIYPNNLSENPVLREEYSQIIYLINLILTPAIRNILLSQIYQGLQEMDALKTIVEDQDAILDEILTVRFNNNTLDDFLTDILPRTAYKYFTSIYDSESDSQRKINNAQDIFAPIIQIIRQIKTVQIAKDSTIIKNLEEYLIPFMANTYQNFIHHLRLAVYGYERYLLNTYQIVKTVHILMSK